MIDLVPRVSVQVDPVHAPAVLDVFRGADPADVPPEGITVDVLNGTGVEMQANDVAGALQRIGFRLGELGDHELRPVARTLVPPGCGWGATSPAVPGSKPEPSWSPGTWWS